MKTDVDARAALAAAFDRNAARPLLVDGATGATLTYAEFLDASAACADALRRAGLAPGDRLCTLLANSGDVFVLYMGALLAGLVIVPIDPLRGDAERRETLAAAQPARVVVADGEDWELCDDALRLGDLVMPAPVGAPGRTPGAGGASHAVSSNSRNDGAGAVTGSIGSVNAIGALFEAVDADALYLITFTSGSTGEPKGVMHSLADLVASAVAMRDRMGFGQEHVFYHNLPMSYMAGILNLGILPLVSGASVVVGERFAVGNLMRFWDVPIARGANAFWLIPTVASLLVKLDRGTEGADYCRAAGVTACVATAPASARLKATFEAKYGVPLYESYGLSETLFCTTNAPGRTRPPDSVGQPLDGVRVAFAPDGEVLIDVPWMFSGYSNVDAAGSLTDGMFRSGDIGEIDRDGFLRITGRKKDLIIRGGLNVSPKKIEDFLAGLEGVDDAVVFGAPDETMGEKIVALVVPAAGGGDGVGGAASAKAPGQPARLKALNGPIERELGRDFCVDEFVAVAEIPKNPNGKVDRLAARAAYAEGCAAPGGQGASEQGVAP